MHTVRLLVVPLFLMAVPASARTSLGIFDGWGAFRDEGPRRCFAIAEPLRRSTSGARAFASVATWPQAGVRGQVHIRLARVRLTDARVVLTVGQRSFAMVAGATDVWAPDARSDAAIVAAMRSAGTMRIATRAATGALFADYYALKGAATAMDAAALGCARATE